MSNVNKAEEQEIKHVLDLLEKERYFNEMDYKITKTEVYEAIRSMKCTKACCLDGILSEMVKNCFKAIFRAGYYLKA